MKLETLTASELGNKVNNHEITPTQVVDYFLDRIDKKNKDINAIVYVKPEDAYNRAKELEAKLDADEYCGPFAGVPFALKDFLPSKKGWSNTHGGVESLAAIDEYDSEFCKAMEKAGGIALGKTNAPAYGFRATTDNKLYGPTCNPFNTEYNSGGSSGGSAAAVASGMVLIAEGGDAGGSIRVPAAWCNCFGFKASFGVIPNVCRPDAWAASHPYCTPGGLTKSVEDAAFLLSYMSRYDSRDPMSAMFDRPDYTSAMLRNVKNYKVAFTYDFDLFQVDDNIRDMFDAYIEMLHNRGVDLELVDFSFTHDERQLTEHWCRGICIDSAIEYRLGLKGDDKDLPDDFLYWNEQAGNMGIANYYDFHYARTEVLDQLENVFDDYDILLSPVTNCLPVKNKEGKGNTYGPTRINGTNCNSLIGFAQTFLTNLTGHPTASVPMGLIQGLPTGIQVIGERYRDEKVLAFSHMLERLHPWAELYKY